MRRYGPTDGGVAISIVVVLIVACVLVVDGAGVVMIGDDVALPFSLLPCGGSLGSRFRGRTDCGWSGLVPGDSDGVTSPLHSRLRG